MEAIIAPSKKTITAPINVGMKLINLTHRSMREIEIASPQVCIGFISLVEIGMHDAMDA
jgi:hypothetical protein